MLNKLLAINRCPIIYKFIVHRVTLISNILNNSVYYILAYKYEPILQYYIKCKWVQLSLAGTLGKWGSNPQRSFTVHSSSTYLLRYTSVPGRRGIILGGRNVGHCKQEIVYVQALLCNFERFRDRAIILHIPKIVDTLCVRYRYLLFK